MCSQKTAVLFRAWGEQFAVGWQGAEVCAYLRTKLKTCAVDNCRQLTGGLDYPCTTP